MVGLRRLLGAVISGVALVGSGAITTMSTAGASENPQASLQPSTTPGVIRPYFILDLEAGRQAQDAVTLVNKTRGPLTFDLYTADAFNDDHGAFVLRRAEDRKRDMGAWVKLPVDHVTVAAGAVVAIPFTIDVPPTARPGDHTGGIVALARTDTRLPAGNGPIRVRIRNGVGARIYGRVSGAVSPKLEVTQLSLQPDRPPGSLLGLATGGTLSYTVKNTGDVRLIPNAKVAITSTFGLTDRHLEQQLQELLPGQSQVVHQPVNGLRLIGRLRAAVTVTAQTARSTRSTDGWHIPWLLLALLALTIGRLLIWASKREHEAPIRPPHNRRPASRQPQTRRPPKREPPKEQRVRSAERVQVRAGGSGPRRPHDVVARHGPGGGRFRPPVSLRRSVHRDGSGARPEHRRQHVPRAGGPQRHDPPRARHRAGDRQPRRRLLVCRHPDPRLQPQADERGRVRELRGHPDHPHHGRDHQLTHGRTHLALGE